MAQKGPGAVLAHDVMLALQQVDGAVVSGKRPNPAAIALRLGLRLRPVVGATYSFDGEVITYDAMQPLTRQREDIARACAVHLLRSRPGTGIKDSPATPISGAANEAFDLD